MNKYIPYSEQLKDPRWQRLRLEIMQRDDFACKHCGDKEHTLSVHHSYYRKGLQPWEYPAESLLTLCVECHEHHEMAKADLMEAIGDRSGFLIEAISMLILELDMAFPDVTYNDACIWAATKSKVLKDYHAAVAGTKEP